MEIKSNKENMSLLLSQTQLYHPTMVHQKKKKKKGEKKWSAVHSWPVSEQQTGWAWYKYDFI